MSRMSLRLSLDQKMLKKRLFTPKGPEHPHTRASYRHMCTVPMHTSEHVHVRSVYPCE